MIITKQKRVPWSWAALIVMPAFAIQFCEFTSQQALSFTTRKYTSDASLIAFIGSTSVLFNFLISPYIAWKSDRIWTPLGRRRPFLIFSLIGMSCGLFMLPLWDNFAMVILCALIFHFFMDMAFFGAFDPLVNEVVPLPQRGRAHAIRLLFSNLGMLYFSTFMIGSFDYPFAGTSLRGETVIYWLAGTIGLLMAAHFFFNVRETRVEASADGSRFSMFKFFKDLFGQRQWRIIYLLVFVMIALNASLASLGPLMMTEQFGYSKQTMGNLTSINIILKIVLIIPLAGFLADRVDRLKLLLIGVSLSTLHPIAYWSFIHLVADNNVPPVGAIIAFDIFNGSVDLMSNVALGPLFFDFVPSNRMGTVYAGFTLMRGIVKMCVVNGVGLWVKYYSRIFVADGTNDYSSGLLYIFILGIFATAITWYVLRERLAGRLIEYGRLEREGVHPPSGV